jgi:hypothetical protein
MCALDFHSPSYEGLTAMVKPDQQDLDAVEKECGRLPSNATVEQTADHYRLAQAIKLLRETGQAKTLERS